MRMLLDVTRLSYTGEALSPDILLLVTAAFAFGLASDRRSSCDNRLFAAIGDGPWSERCPPPGRTVQHVRSERSLPLVLHSGDWDQAVGFDKRSQHAGTHW